MRADWLLSGQVENQPVFPLKFSAWLVRNEQGRFCTRMPVPSQSQAHQPEGSCSLLPEAGQGAEPKQRWREHECLQGKLLSLI